jgi:hypothetical protein
MFRRWADIHALQAEDMEKRELEGLELEKQEPTEVDSVKLSRAFRTE